MKTLTSNKIDYKSYWDRGISYEDYLKNFASEMKEGLKSPYAQYLPQNWTRQMRIHRKVKFQESVMDQVDAQKWLIITEHWCGDASQILPVFQKAAESSGGKIEVRYIYRDENPELIDAHLTDGRSRSIPIVIKLDDDFKVDRVYGPRPAEAQTLTKKLLAEGALYDIPLHSWYAKDRQMSIKDDLTGFMIG